ncbi:hypothetical protein Dd703_1023 [Musicola paradisiaca Ech703]|uniref:Uncharacterized protein n=1 Tax=Musicola paradisiaca (strain Ech703) TaxID=579405 RepID=C6CBP3_MUSP7|nr:hypothetical protein Dd703_1023 [Musicola paradisiaca Ech703]
MTTAPQKRRRRRVYRAVHEPYSDVLVRHAVIRFCYPRFSRPSTFVYTFRTSEHISDRCQ